MITMLHFCCCKELGHSNPSKFKQTLHSSLGLNPIHPFNSRKTISFIGNPYLNHRCQGKSSYGSRVFVGFKVHCVANTSHVAPKRAVFNIDKKKKKKYWGTLPSVLKSLDTEEDIEKALSRYTGELGPKEQTVLLIEQGSWERVLRVFNCFRWQKDYVPNVFHYNVVLRALGLAQRWDELRLCWSGMAKDGVLPTNDTYSILIDVFGKAGFVKESLLWIKHMRVRGIYLDEVTMSTVVSVLKDAGEFDRADRFYKDWCGGKVDVQGVDLDGMDALKLNTRSKVRYAKKFISREIFEIGEGCIASEGTVVPEMENVVGKPKLTYTYNTLIDLYGKAGRLSDAAEVFAEMLRSGVAPDTVTFNTMIHICGSHGYISEAEALLSKMEERGFSSDIQTYTTLLSLHAQAGNVDAAMHWYRKIREVNLFPNAVTHTAVFHMLCERRMVQETETMISEMESSNVVVDEHSVPVIIKMFVNEGLLEKAKTFFEKRRMGGGLSSKTYAAIMDVYAEKGLYDEANTVFCSERDSAGEKKDVLEYSVMIKAFGKAKLYKRAYSVFKSMKNFGTWPNEGIYNSVIQMLAGGNFVKQAKKVLTEMQEAELNPQPQTWSAIIASYARNGLLSKAIDIFHDMQRAGVKANEVVYGALIDGFAEASNPEQALHYFRMMKNDGIIPNHIVITSLMKAYSNGGNIEGARQMYNSLKQLEGGPDIVASNCMINLYSNHEMVPEAKLIFDSLRQKGQGDFHTYMTMMKLYNNMAMNDEAAEVADEMKQLGLLIDRRSFNLAMICYALNGQLVRCAELLHEMLSKKIEPTVVTMRALFNVLRKGGIPTEAIQQLKKSYVRRRPYAKEAIITCTFSVVGLHSFAVDCCEAFIKADLLGLHAYNTAIYAYGSCGQTSKALNIFLRMQDEGVEPDTLTYIFLVECYGRARMVEGVSHIYGLLKYGNIEASDTLCTAIVNAYRNADRSALAKLVSQEMRMGPHIP